MPILIPDTHYMLELILSAISALLGMLLGRSCWIQTLIMVSLWEAISAMVFRLLRMLVVKYTLEAT